MGNFFTVFLVNPIINILIAIYTAFSFLHIPYALGFAIIGLTIVIRFILYPLTTAQLKASMKMQKIAPHLKNLKEKHKGDAKKIQEATMALYKEHGINPAAGCLPVLVQMPIIWALYSVLQRVVNVKFGIAEINKIVYFDFLKLHNAWDPSFFGLSLGAMPSKLVSAMPLILLVPILTGVFQFILSKMMMPASSMNKVGLPIPNNPEKILKLDKKDESDFASAFQTQSVYIFPVMIGFFAFSFPIGLSLYWNTFTIFGIIQQYKITGLGGLSEWIKKK